jgi:hypothetical protein
MGRERPEVQATSGHRHAPVASSNCCEPCDGLGVQRLAAHCAPNLEGFLCCDLHVDNRQQELVRE